jgi:hypothetical protein
LILLGPILKIEPSLLFHRNGPAGRYVMLPDSYTSDGELMLDKTEKATCILTILQSSDYVGDGVPLKFIPKLEALGDPIVIDTETDLDIVFENKPECTESSKWVMVGADDDYPYTMGCCSWYSKVL